MPQRNPLPGSGILSMLAGGLRFSWPAFAIIVLVNTGIAAVYWIEDMRPFWHPLVSVQCYGLAIAYCVNAAAPWASPTPLRRLAVAALIGTTLGMALTILVKGYTLAYVGEHQTTFALNFIAAFGNGVFVSLFFLLKYREARAADALHKAEAERHLLSRYAVESELKLMQAQVEPHFLFNTLASVQFLTETDPPQASRMLGHLLAYLRAALPQLRSASTTLGQEIELAEAYLNILRMRMGPRLDFAIDVPDALRGHAFPPMLLISVVENAVTHGLEPQAAGGRVTVAARRDGDQLHRHRDRHGIAGWRVTRGPVRAWASPTSATGWRRCSAHARRFSLEEAPPRGARATIAIPFEAATGVTGVASAVA